ncbi:MAG: DUF3885 domain-containing protein [Clostridia bacterium]|nr:DUF3885 domain-containing protein [Clostridia bacterium]
MNSTAGTYRSDSKIEKMITDKSFSYSQPWFYNHPFALRCELGIGDSNRVYLKNAKQRANAIFDILFSKHPDAVFFDFWVDDYSLWDDIHVKRQLNVLKKELCFLTKHFKKYDHAVISGLPFNEDDVEISVRRNRVICYTDEKYPYRKRMLENFSWHERKVHFVSFENECILSVYDDRGCDIVFADKNKMREFYPELKPYFLPYDMEEMEKRIGE